MATTRNFHLPLPDPLYRRLREAAERTKQPATALARYAIDSWLRQHRKTRLREAIAEYAVSVAGTADDLDEHLEQVSLDHLSEERTPKKARKKRKR